MRGKKSQSKVVHYLSVSTIVILFLCFFSLFINSILLLKRPIQNFHKANGVYENMGSVVETHSGRNGRRSQKRVSFIKLEKIDTLYIYSDTVKLKQKLLSGDLLTIFHKDYFPNLKEKTTYNAMKTALYNQEILPAVDVVKIDLNNTEILSRSSVNESDKYISWFYGIASLLSLFLAVKIQKSTT